MHECEAESFDFDWCIPLNTEINCTESCMVCFSKHYSPAQKIKFLSQFQSFIFLNRRKTVFLSFQQIKINSDVLASA